MKENNFAIQNRQHVGMTVSCLCVENAHVALLILTVRWKVKIKPLGPFSGFCYDYQKAYSFTTHFVYLQISHVPFISISRTKLSNADMLHQISF